MKQSFFIFKLHFIYLLRRFASLEIPVIFRQDFRLFSDRKLYFVVVHKFLITKPQHFGSSFFIIFCDFWKNFMFSLHLYKQKTLFQILYCWSFQKQLFPIDFGFYLPSKN